MKKIILIIIVILLFNLILINAITQEEINEAKNLIESKVACENLTDDELEIIGEYYMEQMMPGEAHKRAHEMMGLKEGSEAEEQFHINMAKRSYCGENTGMMGGGGMMGNNYQTQQNNNFNQKPYKNNLSIFQIFFYIILILVIIVLILMIILLINKSKK